MSSASRYFEGSHGSLTNIAPQPEPPDSALETPITTVPSSAASTDEEADPTPTARPGSSAKAASTPESPVRPKQGTGKKGESAKDDDEWGY